MARPSPSARRCCEHGRARRGTDPCPLARRSRRAGRWHVAAYRRTCTVSMPARSLKNQPHDVYMSSAWRCASSSVSATTWSAPDGLCSREEVVRSCGVPSRTSMYASRCRPRVAQHLAAAALEHLSAVVADDVERLAQRRSPRLVPTRRAARVTSAVVLPTPHAVRARPCALVHADLATWPATSSTSCDALRTRTPAAPAS